MKKSLVISLTSLILSFGISNSALAQSDLSLPAQYPDFIQEQIDMSAVPDISQPYGPMTVSVDAYGTDLNAAVISWSLNGKKVQGGVGNKSLSFTMGARGETSKVSVTITPINGIPLTRTLNITPEDVDLLWQAESYTPPFYKGKALFPPEGKVTFVAIPEFVVNGKSVDPRTLIYKWIQNTNVLGDQSGYGRNTLTLTGAVISNDMNIQVDVTTLDGTIKARQLLSVIPTDPQAYVYENNPLYGVLFNKAITSYVLNADGVQFEGYPYFFSTPNRATADISYQWLMNGSSINVPTSQYSMLFRNTTNQNGKATISLFLTSATKILQSAHTSFSLTFNQITKNFFGE